MRRVVPQPRPEMPEQEQQRSLLERLAEAHHVAHRDDAVVGGVVGDLVAADLGDLLAGAGQGKGIRSLANPGSTPDT